MTVEQLIAKKGGYTFDDLVSIMQILRGEGGCPWDREQTHESIRKNLIEETYEVVEAIDNADPTLMCEELGDLILQAVFHARISEEAGEFNINDVCNGICEKLIVRHPHIFADTVADTSDEVLKNWDAIKQETKHQKTESEKLRSIPPSMPALMRASKTAQKAAKAGIEIPSDAKNVGAVWSDIGTSDGDAASRMIGDLLFAVADLARRNGVDPEEALYRSTDRFINRFAATEAKVLESGKQMKETEKGKLAEIWSQTSEIDA